MQRCFSDESILGRQIDKQHLQLIFPCIPCKQTHKLEDTLTHSQSQEAVSGGNRCSMQCDLRVLICCHPLTAEPKVGHCSVPVLVSHKPMLQTLMANKPHQQVSLYHVDCHCHCHTTPALSNSKCNRCFFIILPSIHYLNCLSC